jgi:hypothetical protein
MPTPELILTTLGAHRSGRSTFLLGMCNILAAGLYGYFTFTEDPDQAVDLDDAWDLLVNEGELPPPDDVNENKYYKFVFNHGRTPLLTIDWMDYRSIALDDTSESASNGIELQERLERSDSIYLILDGSSIAEWLDDSSKSDLVQQKLRVHAMSSYVLEAVRKRQARGLPSPSLALLITKADLLRGPSRGIQEALAMIIEALPDMLPVFWIQGVTALICPVKVGNFGPNSPETVKVSSIDPVGLHQPFVFSLMHLLETGLGAEQAQAAAHRSRGEPHLVELHQEIIAFFRARRTEHSQAMDLSYNRASQDENALVRITSELDGYPIIHSGVLAESLEPEVGNRAGGDAHDTTEKHRAQSGARVNYGSTEPPYPADPSSAEGKVELEAQGRYYTGDFGDRTEQSARKDAQQLAEETIERLSAERMVSVEADHGAKERTAAEERQGVATAQPSAASQLAAYDDLARSAFTDLVKPGRLLFNPPHRMQLDQTARVEVRLARTLELDAELLEHLHGPGRPQLEQIPAAPLMAVTLKGEAFHIAAYSDEEQSVTPEGISTWEFDIRALRRGSQRLVMCVSLRIPVPGQRLEHKSIPVREAVIDVHVGAPALVAHFVSDNWQWFIGTVIAIAAVLVAILFH